MKERVTMPLPKDEEYTIEDIYNLSEGTRAELIDGQNRRLRLIQHLIARLRFHIHSNTELLPMSHLL